MKYAIVQTIMGGHGIIIETHDTHQQCKVRFNNYDSLHCIIPLTDEEIEKANNNGGYLVNEHQN